MKNNLQRKTPINKQQKNLRKQLVKLSKEEREEHIQLLRFSNTVIIYHEQANKFNPSEADFKEWWLFRSDSATSLGQTVPL